ncbi:MAG: hypothetical protein R3300_13955 [Candidatus Promineifilaceae bacterium]|nr:hypothetical protein [Candidatus Promineifilaceae bacterium]
MRTVICASVLSIFPLLVVACGPAPGVRTVDGTVVAEPSWEMVGEPIIIVGEVTGVDEITDLGAWFLVDVGDRRFSVPYQYPEAPFCENPQVIEVAEGIRVGDRVEVFGELTHPKSVSPCEAGDYYIRRLTVWGLLTASGDGSED